MKPFPSADFTIETDCTLDEVQGILKISVDEKKARFFAADKKPFYGEHSQLSFRIIPNIEYRNSFIPIITGKIRDKGSKTDIEINLSLFDEIILFVLVYLSMDALFILGILIAAFNNTKILLGLIPCVSIFVVTMLLMQGAFNYEVKKRKKQLNEMFYVTFPENGVSSGYLGF